MGRKRATQWKGRLDKKIREIKELQYELGAYKNYTNRFILDKNSQLEVTKYQTIG
jgi:hypothetical protein